MKSFGQNAKMNFHINLQPNNWNVKSIEKDYGHDLNIEIAEDGVYKGLEFIVQLKSSNSPDVNDTDVRQILRVSKCNYLLDNLRVVLLVKFVEVDNEAYWILLIDFPEPNKVNETFIIRIPSQNRLS